MDALYRLKMRVLDGHNVVGYMLESIANPGEQFYWSREEVAHIVDYGKLENVKYVANQGMSGINGFKIKDLPSIQISEARRIHAQYQAKVEKEIQARHIEESNKLKENSNKPKRRLKDSKMFKTLFGN